MLNRVPSMKTSKFRNDESGALLVFFALCVAAIFLIASLSFDLGRRASTQTELQSFADNVALAAAGELNGGSDAIPRAITAADQLIRDNFTFGDGDRTLAGDSDYTITFYASLPDPAVDPLDQLWPAALDPAPEISSRIARYARVEVNSVDVEWVFARLLTIFTSDALPDEAVDAEATAGATTLACDVAPVWFCLPENFGDPDDADAWQDISDGYGSTLKLRTGGGGSNGNGNGNGNGSNGGGGAWVPGNFGWLDVREMIPTEALVDPNDDNPCTGLNGTPLYNCLVGAEGSITTCFANGDVEFLPGQRNGITPAILNTRFDMFNAASSNYEDNSSFPAAAITTKSYAEGSTCASQSETNIVDAMDFPADDCFFGIGGNDCRDFTNPVSGGTEARFGDGVWTAGRLNYVDTNYSRDFESLGTVIDVDDIGSVINGVTITASDVEILRAESGYTGAFYHRDDPFRPDAYEPDGETIVPALNDEYLHLPDGAWKFDYYQAEMALSYAPDNADAFSYDGPGTGKVISAELNATGDNLLPNLLQDSGPPIARSGSSVPTCTDAVSLDPGRRTIVAAAVDCSIDGPNGTINGSDSGIAETYVEIFIQSVVGGTTTNGDMTMFVELLDDTQAGGGNDSSQPGIFRTLVQLYR